jgi:hypothetical protein
MKQKAVNTKTIFNAPMKIEQRLAKAKSVICTVTVGLVKMRDSATT